jgi:hypothetical protein
MGELTESIRFSPDPRLAPPPGVFLSLISADIRTNLQGKYVDIRIVIGTHNKHNVARNKSFSIQLGRKIMKKLTTISIIIVVAFVLTLGLLLASGSPDSFAGRGICPMVGWNGRCYADVQFPGSALARSFPPRTDVGWNS